LRCHFEDAARQLMKSRACLVHGDYSPKNILVSGTRTVVVDAEVGWFGDPAFDLAFMLNHFYLKSLLGPPAPGKNACLQLATAFQRAHAMSMAHLWKPEFEAWVTRLLLMLMLARVDGKSPVQYLRPAQQEFIRRFVSAHLNGAPGTLAELEALWTKHLVEHAYQ
jgi:thiamine kinase-like enzyme